MSRSLCAVVLFGFASTALCLSSARAGTGDPPAVAATGTGDAVVRDVLDGIRHGDETRRMMAASLTRALKPAQQGELLPGLSAIAADKTADWQARTTAAQGLAYLKSSSPEELRGLIAVVRDGGDQMAVREAMVNTLIALASAHETQFAAIGAGDELAAFIGDTHAPATLRGSATILLSHLPLVCAAHLGALVAVYRDPHDDSNARGAALVAIGGLGASAKPAVATMIAVLADPSEPALLRAVTAAMLRKLGPDAHEAGPALRAAVDSRGEDYAVRGWAVQALGAAAPEGQVERIAAMAKDTSEQIDLRIAAAQALADCARLAGSAAPALDALNALLAQGIEPAPLRLAAASAAASIAKRAVDEKDTRLVRRLENTVQLIVDSKLGGIDKLGPLVDELRAARTAERRHAALVWAGRAALLLAALLLAGFGLGAFARRRGRAR